MVPKSVEKDSGRGLSAVMKMDTLKWMIYWNEYASDTYLYGSTIKFHSRDDVEFENSLMPPGTVIKCWYSKTNYQRQRLEPVLPIIDGEGSYRVMLLVEGEDEATDLSARVLLRFVFLDRYEQEVGDLLIRNKVASFQCPLATYSYRIELINAGTTHFHFHSMVIEEQAWDREKVSEK